MLDEAGRKAEAAAAYERALELSRAASGVEDPELLSQIGEMRYQMGDLAESAKWYHRAVLADPTNVDARQAKAILRTLVAEKSADPEGGYAAALAELQALAKDEPDRWEVQLCLGVLLIGSPIDGKFLGDGWPKGRSDPVGGEAALTKAISLRPSFSDSYKVRFLARKLQARNGVLTPELLAGCRADLGARIALKPDEPDPRIDRLLFELENGQTGDTEEDLRILRRDFPRDANALAARARVEIPRGRGAQVMADIEAALIEDLDSRPLQRLLEEMRTALQPAR